MTPDRTSPLTAAQHNEQEFVVESIISHRGNRNKRSTMEFKVRWAGFGESCDTWEPYKALFIYEDPHPQGSQVERTENLFQDFPRNFFPTWVFPRWFLVGETPHISVLLRLTYELCSGNVTLTLYNSRAYT